MNSPVQTTCSVSYPLKKNCWNIRSWGHFFLIWPIFLGQINVARRQKPGGTARGPPHKCTPRHWKVKGHYMTPTQTMRGKSRIFTIHLHCLIPLKRGIWWFVCIILPYLPHSTTRHMRPSGRSQIAWHPESKQWEFRELNVFHKMSQFRFLYHLCMSLHVFAISYAVSYHHI